LPSISSDGNKKGKPMELILNHAQRINLHALFGAQRGPTLDDTRAFWRLQDLIGLSDEDKAEIDYKVVAMQGGLVAPQWDQEKSNRAAPRTFELTEAELARIERAVNEWQPGFFASMDRVWLEPLLMQLEELRSEKALRRVR
jgi:hypothetical protein